MADAAPTHKSKPGPHSKPNREGQAAGSDPQAAAAPVDFIREIVRADLRRDPATPPVTRFPPEPNGYLHIGHAKSICLNFGVAEEHRNAGARCHLRFDDTNPTRESPEYVRSIQDDVRWLGFDWGEHLYFASDYFDTFFDCGEHLIGQGLAFVDSQSADQIRDSRGTLTRPGAPSPWRDRPAEESIDLFRRMRSGEFADGTHVLRARISMEHSNLNMRDPVLYRIVHASHHHTGDRWCVYPMYDFAHPLEDALEGITHSLCTLEFEDHRPLYDWVVEHCAPVIERVLGRPSRPRQIEFARLNLTSTVMSKRKLLALVEKGLVQGWDDPRMPTLSGLRRRGYPPEAIRRFCQAIGITKFPGTTEVGVLEHQVRDELNRHSRRHLGVVRPLKVVIGNWPEDRIDTLTPAHNPDDVTSVERALPFGRELWIDRDDFMLEPPKGFFRLSPGTEVRLRYSYVMRCDEVVTDAAGEPVELRCSVDHDTLGRNPEGRKVKGVIHWVAAASAVACEFRLYDRLFTVDDPDAAEGGYEAVINPRSLDICHGWIEPALAGVLEAETRVQLERAGFFVADRHDHAAERPVLNRIIGLRDSWARRQA